MGTIAENKTRKICDSIFHKFEKVVFTKAGYSTVTDTG